MGCTQSDTFGSADEQKRSRVLTQTLRSDFEKERTIRKLLLLGAGESGKSTLLKQMRIIYKPEKFSDIEQKRFKFVVNTNIVESIQALVKFATSDGAKFEGGLGDDIHAISALDVRSGPISLTEEMGSLISRVWSCDKIQHAYTKRHQFQLLDNAKYFFDNLERMATASYIPSDQDILMTRVRTSGVVEMEVTMGQLQLKVFDVGGQRNERRKWIHCFEGCDAVLFVAAISEYDQTLMEDSSQNRLREALALFGEIVNLKFFEESHMVLFLNKKDLFAEKIKTSDLNVLFPEYTGGPNVESATEFLKQQFLSQNRVEYKRIHIHVTCATDTSSMAVVFDAISSSILDQNLRISGFI